MRSHHGSHPNLRGLDVSDKSDGAQQDPEPSSPPSKPQPSPSATRSAFRDCLSSLGLPAPLLPSVLRAYDECDSRLWLLDNSSMMRVRDSHVGRCTGGSPGSGPTSETIRVDRCDNASRWEELQETVAFHARMASRCWIPTKYWLVNEDDRIGPGNHKFALCWGGVDDVPAEMSRIKHVVRHASLSRAACPLANRLHSLSKGIAKESSNLEARRRRVTIVICTQGLPTDKHGATGSAVRRAFQLELAGFGRLPVKIIVRLCTDDEKVRDMYNTIDRKSVV